MSKPSEYEQEAIWSYLKHARRKLAEAEEREKVTSSEAARMKQALAEAGREEKRAREALGAVLDGRGKIEHDDRTRYWKVEWRPKDATTATSPEKLSFQVFGEGEGDCIDEAGGASVGSSVQGKASTHR